MQVPRDVIAKTLYTDHICSWRAQISSAESRACLSPWVWHHTLVAGPGSHRVEKATESASCSTVIGSPHESSRGARTGQHGRLNDLPRNGRLSLVTGCSQSLNSLNNLSISRKGEGLTAE